MSYRRNQKRKMRRLRRARVWGIVGPSGRVMLTCPGTYAETLVQVKLLQIWSPDFRPILVPR